MNFKNQLTKPTACILFALLILLTGCVQRGPADRPNIVFIMADDLGYEGIIKPSKTFYRTPHIDKLAQSGMSFSNAFCTPLCTPSRVQVMTGQYPFRNGWTHGIWDEPRERQFFNTAIPNFASILKSAGYATAVAGKWQLCIFDDHPNHPQDLGFDEHCLWTWLRPGKSAEFLSRYWSPSVWKDGNAWEEVQKQEVFGPDIYTDFIVDFIERHKKQTFFIYYPMALVHKPYVETPNNKGKVDGMKDRFAGMIEYMDECIGRVLTTLDELNLRKNTLVIFTADNGSPRDSVQGTGDTRLESGKGTMSDSGTHVPFIANWKGRISEGEVCDDLIDFSDVLPTFAEMSGAEVPENHVLDGHSFLPQLLGQEGSPREWVFIQLWNRRAIRSKRWKLFRNNFLYDLLNDPLEETPIRPSDDTEESTAVRKKLSEALKRMK
jgi:arylsulfatase A